MSFPVQLRPGKLTVRPLSPIAAGNSSSTLYLLDGNTNARFLIDSGAEVSLVPPFPGQEEGKEPRTLPGCGEWIHHSLLRLQTTPAPVQGPSILLDVRSG